MKQHPYRKKALPIHVPTPLLDESRIRVSGGSERLSLHWTAPAREPGERLSWVLICIFLGCPALAVLALPLAYVARATLRADTRFVFVSVFLVVWMLGWSIGLVDLCLGMVNAIRGPAPERIVLSKAHLSYRPSVDWGSEWYLRLLRRPTSELRVPWHQLSSLRLHDTPQRQRLILDRDTYWVEVGKGLSEPERAWLTDTIATWADSHGCSRLGNS